MRCARRDPTALPRQAGPCSRGTQRSRRIRSLGPQSASSRPLSGLSRASRKGRQPAHRHQVRGGLRDRGAGAAGPREGQVRAGARGPGGDVGHRQGPLVQHSRAALPGSREVTLCQADTMQALRTVACLTQRHSRPRRAPHHVARVGRSIIQLAAGHPGVDFRLIDAQRRRQTLHVKGGRTRGQMLQWLLGEDADCVEHFDVHLGWGSVSGDVLVPPRGGVSRESQVVLVNGRPVEAGGWLARATRRAGREVKMTCWLVMAPSHRYRHRVLACRLP